MRCSRWCVMLSEDKSDYRTRIQQCDKCINIKSHDVFSAYSNLSSYLPKAVPSKLILPLKHDNVKSNL